MARRIILLILGLAAMFALGYAARDIFNIQSTPDELRAWVLSYGWWGPLAFLLLLIFRHFVFLPSSLVLPVGGACLGVGLGGTLGSIGLLLSALMEFLLFRYVRPEWLLRTVSEQDEGFAVSVSNAAPLFVFVASAIPPTPMTPFYFAASMSSLRLRVFTVVAGVGCTMRAFVLTLLGFGLLTRNLAITAIVVGLVIMMICLACLSPTLRSVFAQSFTGRKPARKLGSA